MVRPSYLPTPNAVVKQMLDMADLRTGDRHVDLGSGDGRFLVAAQQRGAAASVGYELDAELARKSAESFGVDVRCADLMTADLSQFDVVTGFFEQADADLVAAKFEREAKPGARLVLRVHEGFVCRRR